MTELISVLMGVRYQRSDLSLLKRSVESILAQEDAALEFLICDDDSTEEAKAYLVQVRSCDSRVKLVRNGSLFMLAEKLNACLAEASGEWIARMDDDDRSDPARLKKQVAFLQGHSDIAFVGSNVNLVCQGIKVGERSFPYMPDVRDFYFSQPFIHPSLMFRRDVLTAIGGYSEDENCYFCEDYDLLLRLYASGYRGVNLSEKLLDYTISENAKGNRRMRHRWNESVTRWRRFKELNVLPAALPYVVKPLVVGMLPERVLKRLKGLPK